MSAYKFQTGDKFYHTGTFEVWVNPSGVGKVVWVFMPYTQNVSYPQPPAGWVKHLISERTTAFCPQAASRGQSDGDTRPGFVTNVPAGQAVHNITGLVSQTADPYGQGDVFSSDGGNVTIPNIGWPK